MGNKHSKTISPFTDWEKVQAHQPDIEIFKNKKDHQLAEKRPITIDPHYELQDELQIYHMRQTNNDSLVKAFGAEEVLKKGHSEGICSGHKKLEVLTERIPFRLSELPQLTFPEALLFLRESLRAYFRVFKSYGPIHITKRMIGINEFGEVRSWINENWAMNHPNNDLPTLQSTKLETFSSRSTEVSGGSQVYDAKYRDETEMVHNIVAIIEEKCEEGRFPEAFSEEVEVHSSSFRKLSTYVEDFIRVNELFIPPKINKETVFISKYQTRLVEQHQQSGQHQYQESMQQQNNSVTQGQYANQNVSLQGQKIWTTATLGSNNSLGGYQQQSSNGQINYGYEAQKSPSLGVGQGYTVGTTRNTYENAVLANTYSSSYQPANYQQYQSYSSQFPAIQVGKGPQSVVWQKSQSIYKLPQTQNSYTSYQYSTTNPSSVDQNYKYNFGNIAQNQTNSHYTPSQFSSTYTQGFNTIGYNDSRQLAYQSGPIIASSGNKPLGQNATFTIANSPQPISTHYNNISIYPTHQPKTSYQTVTPPQISTSSANKVSFEEFKKNFNPNTTSATKTYQYTNSNTLTNPQFSQYPNNKALSSTLASFTQTASTNPDASQSNATFIKITEQYEPDFNDQNQRNSFLIQPFPPLTFIKPFNMLDKGKHKVDMNFSNKTEVRNNWLEKRIFIFFDL